MLLWCLFIICSLLTVRAEDVKTNLIFVRLKTDKPTKLKCGGVENPSWKVKYNVSHPYTDLTADDETILEKDVLSLKQLTEDKLGFYACASELGNISKEFQLAEAFSVKKMPKSVSVEVGTSSADQIKCTRTGEGHEVVFRWYKREEDSEEGSQKTPICGVENDGCPSVEEENEDAPETQESKKEGVATTTTPKPFIQRLSIEREELEGEHPATSSILKIENAQMEDRAVYICHVIAVELKDKDESQYNCTKETTLCHSEETLMRVKDPLAALWPFAGIVAEVVILCLVIFVCERRRKGAEEQEEDEGYKGNNISSNNSLRQRK